jgi:hypothetical protein
MAALAAIPEEEIWLQSQKSARTRRAYRRDVAHFLRTRRKRPAIAIPAPPSSMIGAAIIPKRQQASLPRTDVLRKFQSGLR